MTVFHLLTMTAGKDVSVLENKAKVSWLKSFFGARWAFAPGEGWKYISENCYVLCAIIQKLTGMTVREYLAPRLFKPLGIRENPAWETDPNGLEAGGWGLFITTEELAKVIDCMSHGGKYQGKQVIPEFWAREAGKAQADNSSKSSNQIDSCVGYGFNFWCCHFPGSYRADGMFSQFGIVLPEYDANIITTCSEVFEQKTRDCLWRHFPEGFIEPKDEPEQTTLPMTLTPLPVLTAGRRNPVLEKKLSYSTIHMLYNPVLDVAGFPVSVLPTAVVYMSADRAGNIDKINLDFSENECRFTWSEGKVRNTIVSGLDGKYRKSKMHLAGLDFTAVSSARWEDSDTFTIWIRANESISERRFSFRFNGNKVTVIPTSCPDLCNIAESIAQGTGDMIENETIADICGNILRRHYTLLEPKLFGRLEMR